MISDFVMGAKRRAEALEASGEAVRESALIGPMPPGRALEFDERRAILERPIDDLSGEVERAVVRLYHLEGYSYSELEAELGVSERTLRRSLTGAEAKLAVALGANWRDYLIG